ncbi:MAG: universal stress protein [Natronomonas sp.]
MRYLVAVDGYEESDKAVEHAASNAAAHGGELTVLHVVPDPEGPESRDDTDPDARGEAILDRAKSLAADVVADHEADVSITTDTRTGRPSSVIAGYAEEIDADGIYLGHRVRPRQREEAVGSVAKSILDTAVVPVTIVP